MLARTTLGHLRLGSALSTSSQLWWRPSAYRKPFIHNKFQVIARKVGKYYPQVVSLY